jgi:predicted Zn finger-like uncharacterized protein
MSYSIQCIHCKAVLKSQVPVPAGKKVKCPRCQQMFTTAAEAAAAKQPAPAGPASAPAGTHAGDDDEMARAIVKLEAEQTFGMKSPPAETKPAAAVQPPPTAPAPASNAALSEEDEMAAAIAKLEGEQTFGTKPAHPETKPASAVQAAPEVKTLPEVTAVPDEDIPQIDDDLVVPDDEESTRGKKRSENEDESSSKKKKSRADAEDDEDTPTEKKKSRDDADEPRSQTRKRNDHEEDGEGDEPFTDKPQSKKAKSRDDDDGPRSKTKRRDDDDEDGDDEPRSKKKRRDDDDEDDGPRRTDKKKKKKKAGSPMMLIVLAGGGILGLFGCCGCGIGGYFTFLSSPVVGKWEPAEVDPILGKNAKIYFEFGYFGTGTIKFRMENPIFQGQIEEGTAFFDYKVTSGKPMIMDVKLTGVEGKNLFLPKTETKQWEVSVVGDTMTLTDSKIPDAFGRSLKLKRAR